MIKDSPLSNFQLVSVGKLSMMIAIVRTAIFGTVVGNKVVLGRGI